MAVDLADVKSELKLWESDFSRKNDGKKPDKEDIARAPERVLVGLGRMAAGWLRQ